MTCLGITNGNLRPGRIERPTLCLEGRCSIQLSYGRENISSFIEFAHRLAKSFGGRAQNYINYLRNIH